MSVSVEEHIVRLHIAVDDALPVDVFQGAAEFRYPKPDCLFSEGFPRDVKSQIAAAHKVNYQVPAPVSLVRTPPEIVAYMYSMSWKLYRKLQINGWFTCSSIRLSRMILRTLSDRTTEWQKLASPIQLHEQDSEPYPTFILPDIL